MAYTPKRKTNYPGPVEPAVISVWLDNTASESNILVPIPFVNPCRLVHAVACVGLAIDTVGVMSLDLELNAAGGSAMGAIDVTGAAGTAVEWTAGAKANCVNLSSQNASRDYINVEVDGSTTASGNCTLYMYFEPWDGE